MDERVRELFGMSLESKMAAADALPSSIARASDRMVQTLLNNGKLLLCGNGGSAMHCSYFLTLLLHHHGHERPALPAMTLTEGFGTLTALGQEGAADQYFARQIQALGLQQDLLVILTTAGQAINLVSAVHAAHEQGMDVIVLSGRDGGLLASHLGPEDIELRAPGDTAAQIRENHIFMIHCFCDLIDHALFNQMVE